MKEMNSLDSMFSPKSIAIIGASGDPSKISYQPVANLKRIGYEGNVYLVNPSYDEIAGYPCYKDISSLPEDIDLALIAINSSAVEDALYQLHERNVKSVVILSAGYSEIGEKGEALEQGLTDFSNKTGIPICGPNSLGIANFGEDVIVSFSSMQSGKINPIAFVAQSGAIGSLTYTYAQELGIGYRQFVSSGNEASVDFFDYIDYFAKKDDIKVLGGYLEGARDYNKMQKALDTCQEFDKPLVLMKVGNSEKGAEAASSHTASLAGNAEVYESYLKYNNVIRVPNEEELTDTLAIFTKTKKSAKFGDIAIITQSGGAGIIMADQSEQKGLSLATLTNQTNEKLTETLPKFATIDNPIDVTAQVNQMPSQIVDAARIALEDENVEAAIIYLQMTDSVFTQVLPAIDELSKETEKILILCWSGIQQETKEELFKYENICWIPSPTRTINALSNVMHFYKNSSEVELDTKRDTRVTLENIEKIDGSMNELDSKLHLGKYGVSIPKGLVIQDKSDIDSLDINYPVVMKALSNEIEHKSDYGLVELNITSAEAAKVAFDTIIQNKETHCAKQSLDGILIEEMAPEGIEVIIGAIDDELFGPCVMFGLGGIFVEVMKDVVIMPAPLTEKVARNMIESIDGYSILEGARSNKKYDLNALVDHLVRISEFCEDNRDKLGELDINPLIVHEEGDGVTAVDALVIEK